MSPIAAAEKPRKSASLSQSSHGAEPGLGLGLGIRLGRRPYCLRLSGQGGRIGCTSPRPGATVADAAALAIIAQGHQARRIMAQAMSVFAVKNAARTGAPIAGVNSRQTSHQPTKIMLIFSRGLAATNAIAKTANTSKKPTIISALLYDEESRWCTCVVPMLTKPVPENWPRQPAGPGCARRAAGCQAHAGLVHLP